MSHFFAAIAALSLSLVSISAATVDFNGAAAPRHVIASVDTAVRA